MDSIQIASSIEKTKRQLRLTWYEEKLMKATKELVRLLREMRDDPMKPWEATHPTFEAYMLDRWNIGARRQQQLLAAEDTRMLLADEAPDLKDAIETLPEGPMREIVQTPPARRVEVLREAIVIQGRDGKRTRIKGVATAATIKRARAVVIDGATGEPEKPVAKLCPHCHKELP